MRRTIVRWSIAVGFFLAFSALGYAQNEAIHGQVTDANGKAMPGATVKVVNSATGETAQDTTDKDGYYNIPLRTGSFAVTASATSFGNASQTVDIVQGDTPEVNFKMLVGGANAQVSVTSTAAQNAITQQQVENLPSNGRNQIDLTLQAPRSDANSVVNDVFVSYNSGSAFQIVVDAQQLTVNIANGFGQAHFSKDAIEQLQMGDRFDATQGRSTKLIANETTKSGTNQFLGRASGYFRNDFLNSPDFMTINPNTGRYITLPYQDQQLSFTFGGPIIKNKAHFFGNYEYERNPQTYPYNSPYNGQTTNGQTFPNIPDLNQNVYSGRSLNTEGGRVDWQFHGQSHLMVRVGYYKEIAPLDYTEYNGTAYGPSSATGINKWDHQHYGVLTTVLSNRSVNIVSAGDAYFQWNEPSQPGVNNPFSSYNAWNGYPSAGIAEGLRTGMGMPSITMTEQSTAPAGCSNNAGTSGTCATTLDPTGTVTAAVASPATAYHFGQEHVGSPELLNQTVWSLRDDYSHTFTWRGGHTLKAGVEWLHHESYEVFSSGNAGSATVSFPWALGPVLPYYFSGTAGNTANALPTAAMIAAEKSAGGSGIFTPATWDLGGLSQYASTDSLGVFGPVPKYNMIRKYYAAYAQDDWALKPNLTINYGLRYDLAQNLFSEDEYIPGIKNSGIPIPKNGFGPRIGFTYKITPATIVRGGFGKYFADCGMQTCDNAGARTGAGPAGASVTYTTTLYDKNLPGQALQAGATPLVAPQDLITIFQSPPPLEGYPTSNVQFVPGATGNAFVPVATGPNGVPSVLAQQCTQDNASGTFSVNATGSLIPGAATPTMCIRPTAGAAGESGGWGWSDNANIGVEHLMGKSWVLNSDFYFEGGRHLYGSNAGANSLWNPDGTNSPNDNFAYVAGVPTLYSLTATTPLAGSGSPLAQANAAALDRVYPNYTTDSFEAANTISNYTAVTTTLIKRTGNFTGSISHTWSELRDATESKYGCLVGSPCVGNGSAEVASSINNYVPSLGTPDMIPAFPAGFKIAEGYNGYNYYSYAATDQRNRVNVNFVVRLPHRITISGLYFFGSGQALANSFSSSGNATNIAGTTTNLSSTGIANGDGCSPCLPNAEASNTLPYNRGVVVVNGSVRTDGGVSPSGNPSNPNVIPGSTTGLTVGSFCAVASIKLPTVAEDPFAVPACLLQRDVLHPRPIERVDARLTKNFKMGERVSTDVFIEAFNLLNHENFGTWASAMSSNTGAGAYGLPAYNYALPFQARMAQFGFKVDFKL